MFRIFFSFAFLSIIFGACSSSGPSLFRKQNLHEEYGKKITDAGLKGTTLGALWFSSAEAALTQPQIIKLPNRVFGYFSADKPRAVGFQFSAKRGEKIFFQLNRKSLSSFIIYADLWKVNAERKPSLLFSADTIATFHYEIEETGTYILRLQPQLLHSGEYNLGISIGPSLNFPVAGKTARIGSVWGDDRDAGARRHEGIDIFAPKRTPVVAAADGVVTKVNEGGIGGKVVWLRPKEKQLSLYYAHLDDQLVSSGQQVKAGDVLGLLGNTGNAQSTSPHLHFGIYAMGGPIDPLPFVDPTLKKSPELDITASSLNRYYRLRNDVKQSNRLLKKNTVLYVSAVTPNSYIGLLPDGSMIEAKRSDAQRIDNQLSTAKIKDTLSLLDLPAVNAASKTKVYPKTAVAVQGYFNEFALVELANGDTGWLSLSVLK